MPRPYHTPRSERDDAAASVREERGCERCGRTIAPHFFAIPETDGLCSPCLREHEETERREAAYGSTGSYLDDTEEL